MIKVIVFTTGNFIAYELNVLIKLGGFQTNRKCGIDGGRAGKGRFRTEVGGDRVLLIGPPRLSAAPCDSRTMAFISCYVPKQIGLSRVEKPWRCFMYLLKTVTLQLTFCILRPAEWIFYSSQMLLVRDNCF